MESATKLFVDVTVVVLVALALGGTMELTSPPDDGDEDGRSAVAMAEDVNLLFLVLQFLLELLFLLLLACCCLVLLLLLRPADALLDCELDLLGFVLLLLGLFVRPLDLGLALDLFLALVLDLDFPMMIKGVDVLAPWVRICVEAGPWTKFARRSAWSWSDVWRAPHKTNYQTSRKIIFGWQSEWQRPDMRPGSELQGGVRLRLCVQKHRRPAGRRIRKK